MIILLSPETLEMLAKLLELGATCMSYERKSGHLVEERDKSVKNVACFYFMQKATL